MNTPEEYMTLFAQEHSYNTWDELMNDCHDIIQIQYTKELLLIYAKEVALEAIKMSREYHNSNDYGSSGDIVDIIEFDYTEQEILEKLNL